MLTSVIVAINDGRGKYTNQYKFMMLASLWMIVCLVNKLVFHQPLSLQFILQSWIVNAFIILMIALIHFKYLLKNIVKVERKPINSYSFIFYDLLLLYSITIPDAFSKFFDRYLINHHFEQTFVGIYSFNALLVMTVYAFFIRPINNVFLSKLSQNYECNDHCKDIIKRYYFYTLTLYILIFCGYNLFSTSILFLLGLEKYYQTEYLFNICLLNASLYVLSYPFINLMAIREKKEVKLIYSIISLALFISPVLFLKFHQSSNYFLAGFIFAYLMNFTVALTIQYRFSCFFFTGLLSDSKMAFKACYTKLLFPFKDKISVKTNGE
jgi:hypothetical protein